MAYIKVKGNLRVGFKRKFKSWVYLKNVMFECSLSMELVICFVSLASN